MSPQKKNIYLAHLVVCALRGGFPNQILAEVFTPKKLGVGCATAWSLCSRNAGHDLRPLCTLTLHCFQFRGGVDVHSCVQFLLDLYTEWFRSAAQPPPAGGGVERQVLCECVRSLMMISDLFTERQQFEWVLATLVTLKRLALRVVVMKLYIL